MDIEDPQKKKWSRRRWCAEDGGGDLADVEEYQPTARGKENRLPIFEDGGLAVVELPGDSEVKLNNALDGRAWRKRQCWRDQAVTIYREVEGPDFSKADVNRRGE